MALWFYHQKKKKKPSKFYSKANLLVHPLYFICHFLSLLVFYLCSFMFGNFIISNILKFYCLLFLAFKFFLFYMLSYLCIKFFYFLLLPVIFNFHHFWSSLYFSPSHLHNSSSVSALHSCFLCCFFPSPLFPNPIHLSSFLL